MKFAVERTLFASALSSCTRTVERRANVPILTHVLIAAEQGFVAIKATNLNMEVSFRVAADIEREGSATILAEMLDGFVQRVKSGVITLDMTDASTAVVKSGKSRLTIPALDPADFPTFQTMEPDAHFAMMGDDLRTALDQCAFAISDDQSRNYLSGVYIHPSLEGENPALKFASCNGNCIFIADRDLPAGAENLMDGFILPKDAAAEVVKLAVTDCEISVARGYAKFGFANGATIATKLIEGKFPDYRRVVPSDTVEGCSVSRKEFADAIDRVSLASDGKDRCVRIEFSPGTLTLDKRDASRGHATEELIADTDRSVVFGLNTIYLGKSLKAFASETVDIFCVDPNTPVLMRPTGQQKPICVISPIMNVR